MSGHVLIISIAICHDYIMVNEVLRLALRDEVHSGVTIMRLARIASALAECSYSLNEEYQKLPDSKDLYESRHAFFPQPTRVGDDGPWSALKFKQFVERSTGELKNNFSNPTASQTRSLYLADLTLEGQTVEVLVKFARTYNKDAHNCLAAEGLAPKLHYCGPVKGGVIMVVMEYVKGAELGSCEKDSCAWSVFDDLRKALVLLDEANIVHGDIRANNIIIDESKEHAKVIDFDWAGEHDKARYPEWVNTRVKREWHEEVKSRAVMKKKHDEFAVTKALEDRIKGLDVEQMRLLLQTNTVPIQRGTR